ncbi:4'-phosphopantetheinyl transferase superfamily protein [Streptomyces sp. NBC_01298]|uniref:4'-phosphopantetheinyl transferase family protein n=1 Tax=Streptomyces sp. NBC_01298 TaxID=2903817 RepID=UPI002E105E48|nr:4'-phosphopantetheinyl transferase superfamily protein [Streptomyces sp. NBC_01298]
MIEELLPTAVAARGSFGHLPDSVLYEEEKALVAHGVEQRRREFATVRGCARDALAALGVPPTPILQGPRGEPRWPDGIVGSMTHGGGYQAAAVARAGDMLSVGIDAEPNEPLPSAGTLALVTLPEEREWLARRQVLRPEVCWDRLLFSAKESVYKAWFPVTRRWLDFEDALITIDPDAGTFHARLLVPGPVIDGIRLTGFSGRWTARRGLLLTAIALPAPVRVHHTPARHGLGTAHKALMRST